jgi:hypothetical protein
LSRVLGRGVRIKYRRDALFAYGLGMAVEVPCSSPAVLFEHRDHLLNLGLGGFERWRVVVVELDSAAERRYRLVVTRISLEVGGHAFWGTISNAASRDR